MTRRHEIDWLRVLLFALLVPHHVAVGFVDWGTDIYGFVNDRLAGDGMSLFIYWSHSWRLPSLFMIAGLGTWFLTARGIGLQFMGRRLLRLLVPLLFATAFINVFGGWAIAKMTGTETGLAQFWWAWLTNPEPRQVQHLWFLINLTLYTVFCWPIYAFRARIPDIMPEPRLLLAALIIVAAAAVVLLKPHAAALVGDNYQFVLYLIFFIGGYLIGADHVRVLDWAGRHVWWLLSAAVILFACKSTLLTLALVADAETGQALAAGGWLPQNLDPPNATLFSVIEAATTWVWCVTAIGLASRYLNRPGRWLPELNRAVFPFYVLHFPLTLVGLAIAAQIPAPWWIEFPVLIAFVFAGAWLFWRLFDALGPAKFLIGGRPVQPATEKPA